MLKKNFLIYFLLLSSTDSYAEDLIPATLRWSINGGSYDYSSSGYVFSSSSEALSDYCSLARVHPGWNRSTSWYDSYITTCPGSGLENKFDILGAENYFSSYTIRYDYKTVPPRDSEDVEAAIWLVRKAFCDDPSFPVAYFEIKNGQYSRTECGAEYITALPPEASDTQCTAGNPIDIRNGVKIQKEIDIYSKGLNHVGFERNYSNINKNEDKLWFNQYQKILKVITPEKIIIGSKKGSPQATKAQTCSYGWNQMKPNVGESWVSGSSAQYVNGSCEIKSGNTLLRKIPILPNTNFLHILLKPGLIQLIRENGSISSFGITPGNEYQALNDERGQLISVASADPIAWCYTTSNGDIEDYNANGKLLSITAVGGMKQELFYDETSGLLARVKDSTNRDLPFNLFMK